jgi:hypothetical protein
MIEIRIQREGAIGGYNPPAGALKVASEVEMKGKSRGKSDRCGGGEKYREKFNDKV